MVSETGIAGYEATFGDLLLAPKGTPPQVLAALNEAIGAVLVQPDARDKFPALWSSHPTRPPGLATPPPLFFLASSFCEPIAPYTAAHDPTP